jgi:ubiquitin C-terminal hydrolase
MRQLIVDGISGRQSCLRTFRKKNELVKSESDWKCVNSGFRESATKDGVGDYWMGL